jgi:hypothetical protein
MQPKILIIGFRIALTRPKMTAITMRVRMLTKVLLPVTSIPSTRSVATHSAIAVTTVRMMNPMWSVLPSFLRRRYRVS